MGLLEPGVRTPSRDYAVGVQSPSGLFPSGPPRPRFREPHPVRLPAIIIGAGMTLLWLSLLGLFATSLRSLFWLMVLGFGLAGGLAALLARAGDRGAAVGVAAAASFGGCVATIVVAVRWFSVGWPLWS